MPRRSREAAKAGCSECLRRTDGQFEQSNANWFLDVAANEHERGSAANSNTLSVCCLPMARGARVETVWRST